VKSGLRGSGEPDGLDPPPQELDATAKNIVHATTRVAPLNLRSTIMSAVHLETVESLANTQWGFHENPSSRGESFSTKSLSETRKECGRGTSIAGFLVTGITIPGYVMGFPSKK